MPTLNQLLGLSSHRFFARAAALLSNPNSLWEALRRRTTGIFPPPTLFHITHYKAGSQWILRILNTLTPDRIVLPEMGTSQFLSRPVLPGKVYPTLYVTREQFEKVTLPSRWRRFVVLRDLRDTLVSAYFSLRYSHEELDSTMVRARQRLTSTSLENGLLMLLKEWLPPVAAMQKSWATTGEPFIRYADLLTQDVAILERVLIDQCRMPVSREQLREVVLANRFEARTKGRERGSEDIGSHERKGVAGDWQNHFTSAVIREFKRRYGELLIATGDEQNDRW